VALYVIMFHPLRFTLERDSYNELRYTGAQGIFGPKIDTPTQDSTHSEALLLASGTNAG
jgi:hypothetical protein